MSAKKIKKPLFMQPISAGFPSPAEEYIEKKLSLDEHLCPHPSATFFLRVAGDSMQDCGIFQGDLLIVDRSLEPKHNDIVVALLDQAFTVKRLKIEKKKIFLIAENKKYKPIAAPDEGFEIWGVVRHSIRHHLK